MATKKKSRKKSAAKSGQRPLEVLEHFYKKTERKQASLKALIRRRGGSV